MTRLCLVCGDRGLHGLSRCGTCYRYLRRRGADRPFALVAALTERDVERELIAQVSRAITGTFSQAGERVTLGEDRRGR